VHLATLIANQCFPFDSTPVIIMSLHLFSRIKPSHFFRFRLFQRLPSQCRSSSSSPEPKREKWLTVPNALCVSRIALSPYLAHLVVNGEHKMAFAVFAYAGMTDLVSDPGAESEEISHFSWMEQSRGVFLLKRV